MNIFISLIAQGVFFENKGIESGHERGAVSSKVIYTGIYIHKCIYIYIYIYIYIMTIIIYNYVAIDEPDGGATQTLSTEYNAYTSILRCLVLDGTGQAMCGELTSTSSMGSDQDDSIPQPYDCKARTLATAPSCQRVLYF